MSCQNCGKNNFSMFRTVCKVCELLDKDFTEKPVSWCDICNAYICQPCSDHWIRRGQAAAMNWGKKVIDSVVSYQEKLISELKKK